MNRTALLVLAATSLAAVRLHAQPAAGEPPEKAKARALLKEGVRLLDAGQLAPALRRFEDAYAAFPSAKILINIGTAQSGLGRWADAVNTYQRYLDSGSDDVVQLPAVTAALAALDGKLGRLAIKVRGSGRSTIELRVASRSWVAVSSSGVVRVAPGRFDVQVRASTGGREVSASGTIAAREQREVVVELPTQDPVRGAASTPSEARVGDGAETQRIAETVHTMATSPSESVETQSRGSVAAAPSTNRTATPRTTLGAEAAAVATVEKRAPAEPTTRRSRWTPLRQGAVVAAAIGGAGLIAMSVLALDARSMWSHAQPEKDLELARRAATRANLATGAGVLGAAALGTGVILWFVGAPRDREPPAITAIVDRTHVGLAVQGAF